MEFTQIVAPTIRELFIERMTKMILSGELSVGEKLPSERELAESMSVSKSIVHLGLEELSRCGLIRVVPRSGSFVADFTRQGNTDTLALILRHSGGILGRDMQLSIVELREVIEGRAVMRLAERHTEEDMAELREIAEEFRLESDGGADNVRLGALLERLNYEICARSGNLLFPMIINAFSKTAAPIWQACAAFRSRDEAVTQTNELLRLIDEGRGEEAAAYLSRNLANYVNNPLFLSSPESTFRLRPSGSNADIAR